MLSKNTERLIAEISSPAAKSPVSEMFNKRKVSEVHYIRNSMNFTNMTIKGQGLIKKDNLMSPTGGEIKPTTR